MNGSIASIVMTISILAFGTVLHHSVFGGACLKMQVGHHQGLEIVRSWLITSKRFHHLVAEYEGGPNPL